MHVTTVSTRVRGVHCAGISRPSPHRGPRNSHRFDGLEVLVHRFTRIDARHDSQYSSQRGPLRGISRPSPPSGASKFPSLRWLEALVPEVRLVTVALGLALALRST